mmetsp:Transcript_32425/g.80013  ORF Transcript_32425/g.80013 Transcript_32425/m.80013 type:complete len:371 (-) Transcript_32425:355-1467(-)
MEEQGNGRKRNLEGHNILNHQKGHATGSSRYQHLTVDTNSSALTHPNSPVKHAMPEKVISIKEKAEGVDLTDDGLTVSSTKGYRTARSTHVVREGAWYFEVIVAHLGDSGHARVGWADHYAELNAPIGFDIHGYGYCDIEGDKVHEARREPYGEAYAAGDVIGCYISIEPVMENPSRGFVPESAVGGGAFSKFDKKEERDNREATGMTIGKIEEAKAEASRADGTGRDSGFTERLPNDEEDLLADAIVESQSAGVTQPSNEVLTTGNNNGFVAYAKNGVLQGVAYHSLKTGEYYPAVSLYTLPKVEPLAKIAFNFGPDFINSPSDFGKLPLPKPLSSAPLRRRAKLVGKLENIATDVTAMEANIVVLAQQ